jgi:thioredoxin-dependent peroxiredoxin
MANTPPVVGELAPAFELPDETGQIVRLSDFRGRRVVLYFYPKDDTSGCTAEAIAFSGLKGEFEAAGARVIGVSKDSAASHDKFVKKHDLTIRLASDESGEMVERYGVWVEKSMYGRKYMGIDRATFLIDGDGTIRRVWRKVKVPKHADEVLAAVKAT